MHQYYVIANEFTLCDKLWEKQQFSLSTVMRTKDHSVSELRVGNMSGSCDGYTQNKRCLFLQRIHTVVLWLSPNNIASLCILQKIMALKSLLSDLCRL